MLTLFRVLFGFAIACLIAGVATVAFVVTPADIANLPAEAQPERLGNAGVLALLAATHSAIFAFPFALIAIGIGELWRVRSWLYYVLVAVAISVGGLASVYLNEVPGQPSIFNNYALGAFLTVGIAAGFAYWLVAGRCAGGRRAGAKPPEAPATPETEPAPQAT
jgi:MFS family permease